MPTASVPSDLQVIALSILFGLIVLSAVVVVVIALHRVPLGHSDAVNKLFRQTRFLELTTVLVILISATFLALYGMLKTEGVAALLSGIAGYVLGGVSAHKTETNPTAPPKSATPSPKPSSSAAPSSAAPSYTASTAPSSTTPVIK